MILPSSFLDELRARTDLAGLVGQRVRLVKRGREHTGLCPFHKEKTPSFTVNTDKGFYHCFGCGKHGSSIDFVMETEGLSFLEAVDRLARNAGLEMPARDPESEAREAVRRPALDAHAAAAAFYAKTLRLPEGRAALDYLKGRGLADETIAAFRLGYAPDRRDGLKAEMIRQGFGEDVLVEAGLLIRDDAGRVYDRFRGRVMFPIADRRSRVVAFGARVVAGGNSDAPKYLNSPETALFKKGATVFALDRALPAIRKTGTAIVVEGYMDAIALHQAGVTNAVAPLGTALTEGQMRILWASAPALAVCLDGDAAGRRAASRALQRALPIVRSGQSLSIAHLPAGEDPDSLVRRCAGDAGSFRSVIDAAIPLSEAMWGDFVAGRDARRPETRAAIEKDIRAAATLIRDSAFRAHVVRYWRDRLWAGAGRRGASGQRFARTLLPPGAEKPSMYASARDRNERTLMALLASHPPVLTSLEDRIGRMELVDPALDRLRQDIIVAWAAQTDAEEGVPDGPARVKNALPSGSRALLEALLADPVLAPPRLVAASAPPPLVLEACGEIMDILDTH